MASRFACTETALPSAHPGGADFSLVAGRSVSPCHFGTNRPSDLVRLAKFDGQKVGDFGWFN